MFWISVQKNYRPSYSRSTQINLCLTLVFLTRCNTTKFPKKKIPRWRSRSNKEVRGRMPLGFIYEVSTHIPFVGPSRKRYREIKWWGNDDRIDYYIKKIVHGPILEDLLKAHYDRTGKYVIPENRKKILTKKVYNPYRNIKEIYDSDRRVCIRLVRDDHSQN